MCAKFITLNKPDSVTRDPSKEEPGTFRHNFICPLHEFPFIIPKASFWHEFQLDAREWRESGETSRFEKSDGSEFLLDKRTGELWPARVIEMLSRYPVFV